MVASHRRTVSSPPPLASVLPSGENDTLKTLSVCPVRVRIGLPVVASHRRTVLSLLALASVLPSGENDTLKTQDVCPVSVRSGLPVVASHRRTVGPYFHLRACCHRMKTTRSHVCPVRVRTVPVVASHRRTSTLRACCHRVKTTRLDPIRMPRERADRTAGVRIPQTHGGVPTCTCERVAIG